MNAEMYIIEIYTIRSAKESLTSRMKMKLNRSIDEEYSKQ